MKTPTHATLRHTHTHTQHTHTTPHTHTHTHTSPTHKAQCHHSPRPNVGPFWFCFMAVKALYIADSSRRFVPFFKADYITPTPRILFKKDLFPHMLGKLIPIWCIVLYKMLRRGLSMISRESAIWLKMCQFCKQACSGCTYKTAPLTLMPSQSRQASCAR